MKLKKYIVFFLLFVFLTLSICAGSQAAKFPQEKCGDCHSDSAMFKEWQTSNHAKAVKTLQKDANSDRGCLKCHSADYKRVRSNSWLSGRELPTIETAGNAVSCSSCHRHGVEYENNLIMPAEKLCISCHVLYCG